MRILADKNILTDYVVPTASFASKKNTISSIEGILFTTTSDKTCDICAFDLEKGIKTTINCIVEEPGCFIINANKITQIVRAMPEGIICIEIDDKSLRCRITGGKACFELQAISGKDFPDLPELRSDKAFSVKHSDLKLLIQKTQFAMSVNHVRPELRGINLKVKNNKITTVSCDGNRISYYSKLCEIENTDSGDLDFDFIVHGDTINELVKFVDDSDKTLKINVTRKHAMFFINDFILFSRLVDAQSIDVMRFIPKNPKIFVTANTSELTSSLERNLLITEEHILKQTKSPVICYFDNGIMTVTSSSVSGKVTDEIITQHEGEAIEIGFNCRFLYDAMKVCDSENVKLSLTSPLMGMMIEPVEKDESTECFILVLPVRLNK